MMNMKRLIIVPVLLLAGIMPAKAQNSGTMDRIETCKENYCTLFGGEALTGQGTDPEMMDILQKFIFGEVFTTGNLSLKQREMITCVTLATMQTLPQLKAHARAALNVGVTPVELREAMYLTAPFIGFPKMLNAVGTVNEVFKERGISLPLEEQGTVTEKTRHEAGKTIQDSLYPGGISSVMEGLPGDAVIQCLPYIGFLAVIKALRIIKQECSCPSFYGAVSAPAGNQVVRLSE